MTAPNGSIKFNNSTGSDTLCSGLGPATPVNGSVASTTSGSAIVTGIDTTGVSVGDLLWVSTSSGRQFSIVASVDSGTQVTCDDNFTVTASGQTWAIGGKRLGLNAASSRTIFSATGAKSDWSLEIEYTGTNYTLTSAIAISTATTLSVIGSGSHPPTIEQTANASHFSPGSSLTTLTNLRFILTNATKTAAVVVASASDTWIFNRCIFGSVTASERIGTAYNKIGLTSRVVSFFGCEILFPTANGLLYSFGSLGSAYLLNTSIYGAGGTGVATPNNSNELPLTIMDCNISGCGGMGVSFGTFMAGQVVGSVIHGNALSGIAGGGSNRLQIANNVISGNGGWGITLSTTSIVSKVYGNAFHSNASGNVLGTASDSTDIILSSSPYVDPANYDFSLNSTVGGGAEIKRIAIPKPIRTAASGGSQASFNPFRSRVFT